MCKCGPRGFGPGFRLRSLGRGWLRSLASPPAPQMSGLSRGRGHLGTGRVIKPCSGKGREDATEGACRGLRGAVSPQGQVWPCWEVWGGPGIFLCKWGELHYFPCSLARSQAMAGPATDPGFLEPGGEDLGIRGRWKLLRVIPPITGKGRELWAAARGSHDAGIRLRGPRLGGGGGCVNIQDPTESQGLRAWDPVLELGSGGLPSTDVVSVSGDWGEGTWDLESGIQQPQLPGSTCCASGLPLVVVLGARIQWVGAREAGIQGLGN